MDRDFPEEEDEGQRGPRVEKEEEHFEQIVLDGDESDDIEDEKFEVDELTSSEDGEDVEQEFEINELASTSEEEDENELSSTPKRFEESEGREDEREPAHDDSDPYSMFLAAFGTTDSKDDISSWIFDDDEDNDFDYHSEAAKLLEVSDEFRNDTAVRVPKTELLQLVKDHWRNDSAEQSKPPGTKLASGAQSDPGKASLKTGSASKKEAKPRGALVNIVPSDFRAPQPLMNNSMLEAFHLQMKQHLQLLTQTIVLSKLDLFRHNSFERKSIAESLLCQLKQMRDVSYQYRFMYGFVYVPPIVQVGDWRNLTLLQVTQQFLMRVEAHEILPEDVAVGIFAGCFPEYDEGLLPDFRERFPAPQELPSGPHRIALQKWGFTRKSFQQFVEANQATWTEAEDRLLAMEISRQGRELSSAELLPSKTLPEVNRRQVELTRRRAAPNAVKDLDMMMQRPLSAEEWRRVDDGVKVYGNSRWDLIQAHLLPGRDKIILERLYRRRERKRKQKRLERERARQRKISAGADRSG